MRLVVGARGGLYIVVASSLAAACLLPDVPIVDSLASGGASGASGAGGGSGSSGQGGTPNGDDGGSASSKGGSAGTASGGSAGSGPDQGGTNGAGGSAGSSAGSGGASNGGSDSAGGSGGAALCPAGPACPHDYFPIEIFQFSMGSNIDDWSASGLPTTSMFWNFGEGRTCPGSLDFGVDFAAYESPPQRGTVTSNFQNPRQWPTATKLHCWMKLSVGDARTLSGVWLSVRSGGGADLNQTSIAPQRLADNCWHEIVLDFSADNPPVQAQAVDEIILEVVARDAPPADGPAPGEVRLVFDDIWVEQ